MTVPEFRTSTHRGNPTSFDVYPHYDDYRDRLMDLFRDLTGDELLALRAEAVNAGDAHDEDAEATHLGQFDELLRDRYPNGDDLPVPSVHVEQQDFTAFTAALEAHTAQGIARIGRSAA